MPQLQIRRKEGRSLCSHRAIGVLACTDESWPAQLSRVAEGAITQAIYTHADDSRPVRSVKSSVVSDLQNSVDQLTIQYVFIPANPPAMPYIPIVNTHKATGSGRGSVRPSVLPLTEHICSRASGVTSVPKSSWTFVLVLLPRLDGRSTSAQINRHDLSVPLRFADSVYDD